MVAKARTGAVRGDGEQWPEAKQRECAKRGLVPPNSEVTPSGVPSKCLTSEDFVSEHLQPEPRSALSAFTWHASTRGPTRTTFAATVTELPAPLASSLPLDPGYILIYGDVIELFGIKKELSTPIFPVLLSNLTLFTIRQMGNNPGAIAS
ncbi:hypothetical protein GUJ93_ZPchr0015g6788 [Zizania palustris]|uniref:Uncharacterized protein n=1 Tax=Zizania palustris TaxID=103762 RepID=A0A8J5TB09_ZIZPA|nr:hypothetical protein GUJ93_ZPchr0015g6788 [Zizania palustris]